MISAHRRPGGRYTRDDEGLPGGAALSDDRGPPRHDSRGRRRDRARVRCDQPTGICSCIPATTCCVRVNDSKPHVRRLRRIPAPASARDVLRHTIGPPHGNICGGGHGKGEKARQVMSMFLGRPASRSGRATGGLCMAVATRVFIEPRTARGPRRWICKVVRS